MGGFTGEGGRAARRRGTRGVPGERYGNEHRRRKGLPRHPGTEERGGVSQKSQYPGPGGGVWGGTAAPPHPRGETGFAGRGLPSPPRWHQSRIPIQRFGNPFKRLKRALTASRSFKAHEIATERVAPHTSAGHRGGRDGQGWHHASRMRFFLVVTRLQAAMYRLGLIWALK